MERRSGDDEALLEGDIPNGDDYSSHWCSRLLTSLGKVDIDKIASPQKNLGLIEFDYDKDEETLIYNKGEPRTWIVFVLDI
jgi:hypothetical protein